MLKEITLLSNVLKHASYLKAVLKFLLRPDFSLRLLDNKLAEFLSTSWKQLD